MQLLKRLTGGLKLLDLCRGTQHGDPEDQDGEVKAPPKLRVVHTAEDLTPEERAFLPHLLEIEETPPSPIQRRLLWTLLALVVIALVWASIGEISVVATAQGKFIPDGKVKQIQPMETAVVKAIHVVEGQHVHVGDLLLELDPTINAAELEASTFPFQKYGTLKGTLVWVSPDAEEKGASDSATSQNGKSSPDPKANKPAYTYKVHVKPELPTFVVDGKPAPIQAGMTVQADIVTDHRRIIEFFLSPVIKYLDEGLKVR